jgi:cytoskeletal protein RodZ
VDVDQISLPYRIALVALLVVCALWFTVLQPKDPAVEPLPTAPGTTGLANDVSAAKGAVAASEASAAAKSAATSDGSTGAATKSSTGGAHAAAVGAKAKPATATGAKTAKKAAKKAAKPAAADRSAPLLGALERDRAVVLLFFNKRGLEDKAVRRAVTGVDRRDGRVVVKAVPVADVARYQAITRGAQVLQAPTALVIAPGKTVKPIVGYTTTAELDQAVGDALAAKRAKK